MGTSVILPFAFQSYEFEWENTYGDINFITLSNPDNPSFLSVLGLDNIEISSSCSIEIALSDVTPPDNLLVCAGNSTELKYNICHLGPGTETADISVNLNISNNPFETLVINPLSDFFVSGPESLSLEFEECREITLLVDLSSGLFLNQEIEVIVEFASEVGCDVQDGEVSTIITIDDLPPSSDFSVLVECMNEPPTVSFIAFEPNSDQTTYAWDFGDGNTSTAPNPTHTYSQNGSYTVMLTVINECGTSNNSEVVDFNCDDDPPVNCPCSTENNIVLDDPNINIYSLEQLIDDGILQPDGFVGCLNLNGTLIIDTDYEMSGATLIMQSSSSIEIEPTKTLEVADQSALIGCDALWDGILVKDDASLIFTDSYISDAFQAVHLLDGSSLLCQRNTFDKNYIGIFIPPKVNNMNLISPLKVLNNTFQCAGNLLPDEALEYNLLFDDISYTGILANNVLLIIGQTGSEVNNTFKDMYNGVRSFNSIIVTSSNLYTNLVSNDNDIETGHAIYDVGSTITSFLNRYENIEYGIRGSQSELKSFRDIFDVFKVGVEMTSSPPSGTISVNDGEFFSYSERAIVVFNSPRTVIECLSNIIRNEAILDFTFQEAISIFTNGSKNESLVTIEDNTLVLGEHQAGITLTNVQRAKVNRNGIIFRDDQGFDGEWSRGFKMSNCIFTELDDNSVFGASLPSSGFETEDSPNQMFTCNSTSRAQVGIKFMGLNCQNTALATSTLSESQDAGLLLSNTIIGGQNHTGNEWCDGFFATFVGDQILIPSSRFEVDTLDDQTVLPNEPVCQLLPETNVDDWFLDMTGDTELCVVGRPHNPITIEEGDIFTAKQNFTGQYNETSNWTTGRYLLKELEEHPEMLGHNTDIDQFYIDNSSSSMKIYNDLMTELVAIADQDENVKDQIQLLKSEIGELQSSIEELNYEILQMADPVDRQALIEENTLIETLISDKYTLYQEILEESRLERIQRARDLRIVNNDLSVPNLAALNEKRMNTIEMNMIINPSILNKVNVRNLIINIANQCPASGGLAVYRARSVWDYINPGNQNDYRTVDDCYQEIQHRKVPFDDIIRAKNQTNIEVVPNPTSGMISILLERYLVGGEVIITNMLGREVQTHKIGHNERLVKLNIKADPGIYFISIRENNKNLRNIKLIKQ